MFFSNILKERCNVRDLKSLVHQGFKSFITNTCFLISFLSFLEREKEFSYARILNLGFLMTHYNEN